MCKKIKVLENIQLIENHIKPNKEKWGYVFWYYVFLLVTFDLGWDL
jgi:hypothetical protein